MKFSLFYHSLVSDWNHGNAHFLRGVVTDLLARGHEVEVFEPRDSWSRNNLLLDHGPAAEDAFYQAYPQLQPTFYDQDSLNLEKVAQNSDIILVHEWNEPWLVNGLGEIHNRIAQGSSSGQTFTLLFHDTHHRAVSDPAWIKRFNLESYDGILAFGEVLSDVYRSHGWSDYVWTWHEAADTRVFYPRQPNDESPQGDLVWIGNWGDDERTHELETFLFNPVEALGLRCNIYGVRYPQQVLEMLQDRNISYHGWLANFNAPLVFANHKVTVHVPRRYYADSLPGIPTIRPFEAMACGIPLVTAPWKDSEHLFQPGQDFLVAKDSAEMQSHLSAILNDPAYAAKLADHALATIRDRHSCTHRVDQLLDIIYQLQGEDPTQQTNATGRANHAYG